MSFANKVVLITGASSGIGAAIAIAFAKDGANVVMIGRNEVKLRNVAEECEKNGPKPLVIKADITDDEQVQSIIKDTIQKFGKLDVLVNNAGLGRYGSLTDGNMLKAYDEVMKINMRAQVSVTSQAVKHIIESKGNIINISSVAGSIVSYMPTAASYHISKAALNHFTICAALELSKYGVRVNSVSPGPVRTDFIENANLDMSFDSFVTALGRVSEPEEVADIVLFLVSEKAKGITGSNYILDNGFSLRLK